MKVADRIARITNPDQMASALANTEFGPIDVLLLQVGSDRWMWRKVEFSKKAFDGPHFSVHSDLPNGYVLITRKG